MTKKEIKEKIKHLKNNIKIKKNKIQILSSHEKSIKIILNSVYGSMGATYSPYYDVDIAEAITISGQEVTKGAMKFVERYFNEHYSQPIDIEPVIIAGDTDSTYLNLNYLTEKVINGEKITLQNLPVVDKEIEKVRHVLNKWCENELSKNVFHAYKCDRLHFEREVISDISYFLRKKHYICHLIDIEGQTPEEGEDFKYKGLAIVKSTYPKFAKDIMHYIFEKTIKENLTEMEYLNYISEKYEEFKNLPIDDISIYQNVNTESPSKDFLISVKGDTYGAKSSLYYNQIIEKLHLEHKYDLIVKKSKVRIVSLNSANIYGLSTIAYPEIYPDEFNDIFTVNYRKQFDKIVLKPLDNFIECNNWSRWSPEMSEVEVNIMSL